MSDAQPIAPKPLGRNQKWAAVGYAIPFSVMVVPSFAAMTMALVRNDPATQLALVDRLASFASVYGLVAVGCVLGIAGAVKGIGSIAESIAVKAAK